MATPITFDSVVGIVRNLDAATPQTSGGDDATSSCRGPTAERRATTSRHPRPTRRIPRPTAAAGGPGTVSSATYFDNLDFTGATVTRIDPTVDFAWGSGSPAPRIGADTFSVRWTGQVQAPFSKPQFYTVSDDGVRLWVNGSN